MSSGEAKLEFRNYTIIGPESIPPARRRSPPASRATGWNFVELFYRNQGEENSGYVNDEFLTGIAKGAGVPDIAKWNKDRKSKAVAQEVSKTTTEAPNSASTARRRLRSRARAAA